MALFRRIHRVDAAPIAFTLDGEAREGREGDTLLTAILVQADVLRTTEFEARPRAGFCQMGACQDCWVALETGERLRACTTLLAPGMRILTGVKTPARRGA